MKKLALAAALLLTSCGFFKDPNEPSEKVLRPTAAVVNDFPPNAASMTAEQWLQQSLYYHKQSRYLECIAAAQTALFLKPDFAEAWNNIGVAYSALHLWDLAIQAETQAVRLKPNFELAKNNIVWAQTQKQRGVK